jgi:hypothetical protein
VDIEVDGGEYEVRQGKNRVRTPVGRPMLVRGGQLMK